MVLLSKDPTLLYLQMLESFKLSKKHHPSLSDGNDQRAPVQLLLCIINLRTRQLIRFNLQDTLSCSVKGHHSSLYFLQLQSEAIKEHDSRHVYTSSMQRFTAIDSSHSGSSSDLQESLKTTKLSTASRDETSVTRVQNFQHLPSPRDYVS